MKLWTPRTISLAADDDLGICLECGWSQPFYETRLFLGLCENCGEQRVIRATDAEAVLNLLQEEDE